ncbi:MAG: anaerobic ribonucleoside-triphosphate reductase activating protein [Candidatus Bathyarchaeia archaeon]
MKLPEIKILVPLSCVDWDGKVSAVAFLPRCNFRCPFCYNTALVLDPESLETKPFEEIRRKLEQSKGWLDGLVITGGEPTINEELPSFCGKVKELGLGVKLDTNGTNPDMLRRLVEEKLVDYVALDVKAPLNVEAYSRAVGVDAGAFIAEVERTIHFLLRGSVDYEFRTTLVPTIHREEDVERICSRIEGCKKYFLQNFVGDVETLDPELKGVKPFSEAEMKRFVELARKTVPNTLRR